LTSTFTHAQPRVVFTFGQNTPPDLKEPGFQALEVIQNREKRMIQKWKYFRDMKVKSFAQFLSIPDLDIDKHFCVVELSSDCEIVNGQKVLPDGTPWMPSLMKMIGDTIFYIAASSSDDNEVRTVSEQHLMQRLGVFFSHTWQNVLRLFKRTESIPKTESVAIAEVIPLQEMRKREAPPSKREAPPSLPIILAMEDTGKQEIRTQEAKTNVEDENLAFSCKFVGVSFQHQHDPGFILESNTPSLSEIETFMVDEEPSIKLNFLRELANAMVSIANLAPDDD